MIHSSASPDRNLSKEMSLSLCEVDVVCRAHSGLQLGSPSRLSLHLWLRPSTRATERQMTIHKSLGLPVFINLNQYSNLFEVSGCVRASAPCVCVCLSLCMCVYVCVCKCVGVPQSLLRWYIYQAVTKTLGILFWDGHAGSKFKRHRGGLFVPCSFQVLQ